MNRKKMIQKHATAIMGVSDGHQKGEKMAKIHLPRPLVKAGPWLLQARSAGPAWLGQMHQVGDLVADEYQACQRGVGELSSFVGIGRIAE